MARNAGDRLIGRRLSSIVIARRAAPRQSRLAAGIPQAMNRIASLRSQ
jgi:hypothetical protein